MSDEGFREIQLSGKQLIALFMTAAVVLIATFLCGVLVGRGVRAQQEPSTSAGSVQAAPGAVDPTAAPAASAKPAPSAEQPGPQAPPATPPPPPEEDPALYARGQAKPAPAAPPAAAQAAAPAVAAPEAQHRVTPAPVAAPAAGEPAGNGFFLKVVAYSSKAQADKVAASLSANGFSCYVVPVTGSKGKLYSVRVGKFPTRKEAEAAKLRLEQEDYRPSIAR